MRWTSLFAALSVVLVPAANAGPCRVSSSSLTTSSATETPTSTPISTTTTLGSSSTPVESSTTTTPIESSTTTTSETSTTPSSTPVETPSSTPTPIAFNYVHDGDFEDDDSSDWSFRTVTIENDARKANSPTHYALFAIDNQYGGGGNQMNQTLEDLDTGHLYRLEFSGAVLDTPDLGDATCTASFLIGGETIESWRLENFVVGQYDTYEAQFVADWDSPTITIQLKCTTENAVTIHFGVDDVIVNDLGLAPQSA